MNDVQTVPPAMPRWVKVFLLVGAAAVIVIVAVVLISGGEHGPGRHLGGHGEAAPGGAQGPQSVTMRSLRALGIESPTRLAPEETP